MKFFQSARRFRSAIVLLLLASLLIWRHFFALPFIWPGQSITLTAYNGETTQQKLIYTWQDMLKFHFTLLTAGARPAQLQQHADASSPCMVSLSLVSAKTLMPLYGTVSGSITAAGSSPLIWTFPLFGSSFLLTPIPGRACPLSPAFVSLPFCQVSGTAGFCRRVPWGRPEQTSHDSLFPCRPYPGMERLQSKQ